MLHLSSRSFRLRMQISLAQIRSVRDEPRECSKADENSGAANLSCLSLSSSAAMLPGLLPCLTQGVA
jgi:hypothetical protein